LLPSKSSKEAMYLNIVFQKAFYTAQIHINSCGNNGCFKSKSAGEGGGKRFSKPIERMTLDKSMSIVITSIVITVNF